MDNNMPEAVKASPTVPPAPNVTPATPPQGEKEGNKMVLWLCLGLVLIILVVGGIYWYLSNQQKSMTNIQTTTQSETQTTGSSTPTPENLDTLGTQVDSANVPDATQDFSALDKDLQNL